MQEYSGTLGGLPWIGWTIEREDDLPAFRAWIVERAQRGERVAVDTEGKGLKILSGDPEYVRLVQFGTETESWTVPVCFGPAFKEAARWALVTLVKIAGHNWHGFDALALHAYMGLDYRELCDKAMDTWVWAKLWDPREKKKGGVGSSLKPLSAHFIDPAAPDTQDGLTASFKELKVGHTDKNPVGWALIPALHPVYQEYAHLDVILTSRLLPILQRGVATNGTSQHLVPYEHALARICGQMTIPGLLVAEEYTRGLSARLLETYEINAAVAAREGVDNINSNRQLIAAFQAMGEEWGPTDRTPGGELSVGKEVLYRFADLNTATGLPRDSGSGVNPLAMAVIKAKRAGGWRTSYTESFLASMDPRGAIHANIKTMEARTGRMSVTNPAVQTLPSGEWSIRTCLMMEEGHRAISVDFDGVELNVLAALADVKQMKAAIARKEKLHNTTSRLVFGEGFTKAEYKVGKAGNFLKIFGGGQEKLRQQTGAPAEICAKFFKQFNAAYPEVGRFGDRLIREAYGEKRARGDRLAVRTKTGRVLPMDRDRLYAGVNYAVQSTARDCLGRALVSMDEAGLTDYLRLAVHDEVIASAPEREADEIGREIAKHMNFDLFGVPITATPEVGGRTWGSLYMKDEFGKVIPQLAIEHDEFYASNPQAAYAAADA